MEQDIEHLAQESSVWAALEVGFDLEDDSGGSTAQLAHKERDSTEYHISNVGPSIVLCQEIDVCDGALGRIEGELCDFKSSLGQLSSDICTLQTRSQTITIKLQEVGVHPRMRGLRDIS
jgi:hypothetical protein